MTDVALAQVQPERYAAAMVWPLSIALALLAAEPPPEAPAESRRFTAERPRLLWEEGPAVTWTLATDPPRSVAIALDAPVFAPDAAVGSQLVAHVDAGARVALTSGAVGLVVLEGPRSWRLTLVSEAGDVAIARAAGLDAPAAPTGPDAVALELPNTWATGPFSTTRAASPAPTIDAPGLRFLWPSSRAVRPHVVATPPRVSWLDPDASGDARYDLEVTVVDGSGTQLGVIERWWKIAGPGFRLFAPWPDAARIALALSRVGQDGITTTTDVLTSQHESALETLRAGIAARVDVLGPLLTTALDAMALEQFGLDGEARAVWWHLGLAMTAHPRGPEVAARSGAWPH